MSGQHTHVTALIDLVLVEDSGIVFFNGVPKAFAKTDQYKTKTVIPGNSCIEYSQRVS